MPIPTRGKEVLKSFMKTYGGSKKGKEVFYSKANKAGKESKFYQLAHGK
jgi:hypothetical protein